MKLAGPLALLALAACADESPGEPRVSPATTLGTTFEGCEVDPALQVTSLRAFAGPLPTQVELAVTLSSPARVAARCVDDRDGAVFFTEGDEPGTEHALRLSGLVPSRSYTCSAAPTCPATTGRAASVTYEAGEPPADLAPLDVVEDAELGLTGAWTLAPFTRDIIDGTTWLVIWGPDGTVRWWHELPPRVGMWVEARWHAEDGRIVWGGGMDAEGRPHVVDLWDGEGYAWAPPGWEDELFHHDGKRLDDGRLLTLELRENTDGLLVWDGFGLRAHDPATGDVSFDFDSQSLVDAGQLAHAFSAAGDPWHANWVDRADAAGVGSEFVVSLCMAWQMLGISESTGELTWLLGRGLGWSVLDEAGEPLAEDALPQCQHGVEITGDRQLLVYDNGQGRDASSVSEWRLDPATKTAQRLWYWTEPGWAEDYVGDVDALSSDRVWITQATMFGDSELVEVDRASGAAAGRLVFGNGGVTYRSERYGGCDLFDDVSACDALAARHAALATLLVP